MQRRLIQMGLVVAVVLAVIWLLGGFVALRHWAEAGQREVQTALARAVQALRAGKPGALAALLSVCFGYGFLHAVGPGHGKLLIGSYGVARRVRMVPLAGIALASSLAQAAVAVGLVYAFVFALGWTRERVEGMSAAVMTPISYAAVAGVGLWLVLRGVQGLRRVAGQGDHDHPAHADHPPSHADHAHNHHAHDDHAHAPQTHASHAHDEACGCGHAHGPTLAQMEGVTSLRDAAVLVAGIAMRPCSGALFLLILTWKMQIAVAGIAGVFAMGLGTGLVTIIVAMLAVWTREGALRSLPGAGLARAVPVLELVAGAVVALVFLQLLIGSL